MAAVASKRVWSAKSGSHLQPKDAERVVEFMDDVFPAETEVVTTQDFVDKAKGSAIEDLFEWDDSVAGPKYRLTQAGNILRSVTYQIVTGNGEPKVEEHRAFLVVHDGEKQGYQRAQVAWREHADQLIVRAERELLAFREKYAEFEEVVTAIDEHVLPRIQARKG